MSMSEFVSLFLPSSAPFPRPVGQSKVADFPLIDLFKFPGPLLSPLLRVAPLKKVTEIVFRNYRIRHENGTLHFSALKIILSFA